MPVIAVGAVLTLIDNGRQREFGFRTCRSTPAGSTGVFRREYRSIPPGVLEYSAGSTGTFRQGAENKAGDAAVLAAHGMACTGRIGARRSGQCGLFGIFQQICIRCSRKFDKFATISLSPKDQRELAHLGLTRNRTFKNDIIKQVSTICSYNEPDTGLLQPDLSEQLLSVPSPPAQMTQTGFVASA